MIIGRSNCPGRDNQFVSRFESLADKVIGGFDILYRHMVFLRKGMQIVAFFDYMGLRGKGK
jgi:hypothetical protein